MPSEKSSLRSKLLAKRQTISNEERTLADKEILASLKKLHIYRASSNVGIYLNLPSEAPTNSILAQNTLWRKKTYVPVVTSQQKSQMRFAKITPKTRFEKNSLGVNEPIDAKSKLYSALELDIIFLPLVGFDHNCNRLGMGKGFYDRFLQHRLSTKALKKPILIGLAFPEQALKSVPTDKWDVPLDLIILSSGKIIWKPSV